MGLIFNLLVKVAFIVSIILHVMLWPSVSHIVFACVLAIESIVAYVMLPRSEIGSKVFSPSLFFFHDEKSRRTYGYVVLIFFYMLYTFLWFAHDEIAVQPRMTTWIDGSLLNNYTFTENHNTPFPGTEVTSETAKRMRDNIFEWPRALSVAAIPLVGAIPQAGAGKTTLNCPPLSSNNATPLPFACFASRLFSVPAPSAMPDHSVLPAPSQFYSVDVTVTPPPGVACYNLEVYRIITDRAGNVDSGLDYPASTMVQDHNNNSPLNPFCSVFNVSGWCLHFQHTFTNTEYVSRVATKCAEGKGSLLFRLPSRAIDIEPTSGKINLDALIVTRGASVHLDFKWQEPAPGSGLINNFQTPWVNPDGDGISDWRQSSSKTAVFFKFFFLITPLLLAWYFLGLNFMAIVVNSQILLLCIHVLLPSILIFLSMGAWLPMAGSIVCVIAINHTPDSSSGLTSRWRSLVRPALFFITAACNSIQFAWLLTLVGQAGYSAFLFEGSIRQLAELSSKFIISDSTSPTWVGLMLPSLLLVNLAFLLGSAVCIVLETLPRLSFHK